MIDRWNAAVVDKKQVVAGGATYPSGGALTVKTYGARNDVETDVTLVGDH